jgi:hypothetical protein
MSDRSTLVRPAFLIAAAGAMLMAGTIPAAASAKSHSSTSTAGSTTTAAALPDKNICVSYTITGSLLPKRVCKTKAEWEAQGAVFKAK